MAIIRQTATAGAALLIGFAACARNPNPETSTSARDARAAETRVTIAVRNNNRNEMGVYALTEGGASVRVGSVFQLSSATFSVDPILFPSGVLRLVASPIGGGGTAQSGPVPVYAGQTVVFTIGANLATSFAQVK